VVERGLIASLPGRARECKRHRRCDFIMMEGEDADRRLDLMMGELSRAQKPLTRIHPNTLHILIHRLIRKEQAVNGWSNPAIGSRGNPPLGTNSPVVA
jgi:hypothetical protein